MARIFGHRWASSYGETDDGTWEAGLSGLTEEEIKTGIVACLRWRQDWPPTLPQFRELCRPPTVAAHRLYLALPEPNEARERRKAVGLAAIASLREESSYRDWLSLNAGRDRSPLETMLGTLRALIATANIRGQTQ